MNNSPGESKINLARSHIGTRFYMRNLTCRMGSSPTKSRWGNCEFILL